MEKSSPGIKKSFFKKIVIAVVVLGMLLLGAACVAPFFIPWDQVRIKAAEEVSRVLKRKVTMEKVSFNLFEGLEISKLFIANAEGFHEPAFITDEKLIIKYRFWPILFGQVVIKSITLTQPTIAIERNKKGVFNFSDLTSSTVREGSSGDTTASTKISFSIAQFTIHDGSIIYNDDARETPLRTRLDKVDVKVGPLALTSEKPSFLSVTTLMTINQKSIPLTMAGSFFLNYAEQKIKIKNLNIKVPSVLVKVNGDVNSFMTTPSLNLDTDIEVALKTAVHDLIPSSLVSFPPELVMEGQVVLKASVLGHPENRDDLKIKGELIFNKVGVRTAGFTVFEALQGIVDFSEHEVVSRELSFQLSQSPITLRLQASPYKLSDFSDAKKIKAQVRVELGASQLNLDKFFEEYLALPYAERSPNSEGAALDHAPVPDLSKKIPPHLSGVVSVKISKITLRGLELNTLDLNAELQEQKLKQDLKLAIYDGRISQSATVILTKSDPIYELSADVQNFKLDQATKGSLSLIAAFIKRRFKPTSLTPQVVKFFFGDKPESLETKNKISGILNTHISMSGEGLRPKMVMEKLNGKCSMELFQAGLSQLKILENVGNILKIDALKKDLELDVIKGNFEIKNQKITTKDFVAGQADQNMVKLHFDGGITFDKTYVEGSRLNLKLNPQLAQLPSTLNVLKDDKGWAEVDLGLKGDLTNPQVIPDFQKRLEKGIRKQVDQKIEEGKKQLEGKVKEATEELKKKGEDLLKGIFK